MKLLDVNPLLYALDETSRWHERARPWLEETLSGSETGRCRGRCCWRSYA